VLETRTIEETGDIRRRRSCKMCGRRFNTIERVEEIALVVVKRDGRREAFDREKILSGLRRACEKRPVATETIEGIATRVERELRSLLEREVPSQQIGERVLRELRHVDGVAYVRFASVYLQFQDVAEFQEQVEKLLGQGRNH
jgi:transcriptional repressor NrdR